MSLNFVKTSVLSSDNGIDFGHEQRVESEEAKEASLAADRGNNKSLYEQLQENENKKQEEFDRNTKLLFAAPKGLDDEDISFLNAVSQQKQHHELLKAEEEMKLVKEFRSQQREHTAQGSIPILSAVKFAVPEKHHNVESQSMPVLVKRRRITKDNKVDDAPTSVEITYIKVNEEQSKVESKIDSDNMTVNQTPLPSSLFGDYGSDSD